jgi:hypothetical protein
MKGASAFKKRLLELTGNNHTDAINALIKDVKNSGAKNIAFKTFNVPAAGVSKENGDLFIADNHISLSDIMFVTLHESAHQLQYRKYGSGYALNVWYDGFTSGANNVASKVKEIEDVANRYAFMKFKKYQVMFGLPNISYHISSSTYMPEYAYAAHMTSMFQLLKSKGINTKQEIKIELDNFLN